MLVQVSMLPRRTEDDPSYYNTSVSKSPVSMPLCTQVWDHREKGSPVMTIKTYIAKGYLSSCSRSVIRLYFTVFTLAPSDTVSSTLVSTASSTTSFTLSAFSTLCLLASLLALCTLAALLCAEWTLPATDLLLCECSLAACCEPPWGSEWTDFE